MNAHNKQHIWAHVGLAIIGIVVLIGLWAIRFINVRSEVSASGPITGKR